MLNDLYNKSFVSTETFEKIKCPVLIMCGDRDEYLKPESFLAGFNNIADSQLLIIPDCGHVVFFCNFPAVWESIKIFLWYED
jgi:pimeloyl-ACP methyl ester carboxylesterase